MKKVSEAQKCDCPHNAITTAIIFAVQKQDSTIITGRAPSPSKCKTNGCMMWRWGDVKHTQGYCGLAGTPKV